MNGERCLQQITGSCCGCNVVEIAQGRIDVAVQSRSDTGVPVDRTAIAQSVAAEYCPAGTTMGMLKRVRQSVW